MKQFVVSVKMKYMGVCPIRKTFFPALSAPSIYLDAVNEKEAEELARNRSGLGRFSQWGFTANEVKVKN